LPQDVLAGQEAQSVTQLKQAGALILGKTVTTEFAYFAPGPTRNPHNLAHTPGGSSSGSAAGVAAGLCPLALGTQTIGSVIRPASFCGVVGFKPSFGRISVEGVIPVSVSLDHVGCFTQDVAGAILAAQALVPDWNEIQSKPDRPVLGVPDGPYLEKTSTEGLAHFKATQQKLVQAGYEIRPIKAMADFEDIVNRHKTLMAAEMAMVHQEWFAQYKELYRPETVDLIQRGQQVSAEMLEQCLAGQKQLRKDLMSMMVEQGIDMWVAPAAVGSAPATLESTGDPIMNLPWTQAGLPAINLPTGLAENGLPLGLQLVAGWQEDENLLGWAGQIAKEI
jgi:Asp-tRNA(Asn)/Glu-tRNA(Gln) amidotransferase A subunit family amidase